MTAKFDRFKAALVKLCEEHGVVIGSELYDSPAVWDRIDHEPVIHADALTDKTQSQRPLPGERK